MSLLSLTVKKAQFSAAQAASHQWNSYVTLKLQHVKSTTVTVKGPNPSWEQDFLFEVNNLDAGLLIEVWSKGVIWDRAVGYHWLHLRDIPHSNVEGIGQWLSLEADLVMRDGEVVGTKTATAHAILIDARFELPYASDVECDEAVDLQRKLEMLNSMMCGEQARKQHQYYIQSGVSEDSDYTSDINYPTTHHPNSSASQFLSAANQLTTPQRSLTSSRENSYEKDDDYYHRTNGSNQQHQQSLQYYHNPSYPQPHGRKQLPTIPSQHSAGTRSAGRGYWEEPRDTETDPLYYNSRPQSNYKSRYRRRGSWEDEFNQKRPEYSSQYDEDYDDAQQDYSQPSHNYAKRLRNNRRGTPNLERQYTLYDGTGDYAADEEIQGVDAKAIPYVNEPYSSYNQQNTDTNSVYNDYNQQDFSEYPNEMAYDDGYTDTQTSKYDPYAKDSSYVYDEWKDGDDTRDHYSAPSKFSKELPQASSHYNQKSQSSDPSPFNSQSTVKEMSVAPSTVHSAISHHQDYSATNFPINSSDYGNVEEDASFYDASSNYNNNAQGDHLPTAGRTDATVPINTTTNNKHTEQYMDAYENQTGYEDWQNYGYYDETGNYIEYDQNPYYQAETASSIPTDTQPIQNLATNKDIYSSYYDQSQDHSAVTTYDHGVAADINTTVSVHPEPSTYNEQYDPNYYTGSEATDQQLESYDQPVVQEGYNSFDQDGYWFDAPEELGYFETQNEQPLTESVMLSNKGPQSNDEYNYAYQSAENLTTYEPSLRPKLDKAESVSRRESFRRQISTRSDYGPHNEAHTSIPQSFKDANHIPPSKPLQATPVPNTSVAPTNTTTISAAAGVASKLASEMKSALPQLSSLTKGKTDLFSSSFSKLGNFVSNAASKTGVSVSHMTQPKDVNKDNDKLLPSKPAGIQPSTLPDMSVDPGLGYSLEDQQYIYDDNWDGQYDQHYDGYSDYLNQTQEGLEHYEGVVDAPNEELDNKGPVHMDSLESNVSEGTRDDEDLEAEYWQKQQERIDKHSALQAEESKILKSMDSTDEKYHYQPDYLRGNSLDTEEFLEILDKQSGGQKRPVLSKRDTMSISLERSESIDQQTDYGDDFDQDHDRGRHMSLESGEDGYAMSPPPRPIIPEEEIVEDGHRKSSLEIQGKAKEGKSVSFEEEPPKPVPERQTKGMNAREKWLWAINRICGQLAVSILVLIQNFISFRFLACRCAASQQCLIQTGS